MSQACPCLTMETLAARSVGVAVNIYEDPKRWGLGEKKDGSLREIFWKGRTVYNQRIHFANGFWIGA